jgi:hypothetical protein
MGDGQTYSDKLHDGILKHLRETRAVVLQGPPGTGKTYASRQVVRRRLLEAKEDERYEKFFERHDLGGEDRGEQIRQAVDDCLWSRIADGKEQPHRQEEVLERAKNRPVVWSTVQLHPGYSYEDFVRGMGTSDGGGISFEAKDRIVAQLAEVAKVRAEEHPEEKGPPVVLVLDEINRCNLASVLGELILVLEKDKRWSPDGAGEDDGEGWPVRLQYPSPKDGGEPDGESEAFQLPENLWFLGTMNTADRSIAMVDYAIRRRFRFIDILPRKTVIDDVYEEYVGEEESEEYAKVAKTVYEKMNSIIPESQSRLKVGHSYFLANPNDAGSKAEWRRLLAEKIVYEVLPLLREYRNEGRLNQDDGLELGGEKVSENDGLKQSKLLGVVEKYLRGEPLG